MSDNELTPEADEELVVEEDVIEPLDDGPKGMRETIKAQNKRIKELEQKYEGDVEELKEQAMARAYESLNLNPESGIGKAAAQTYEGEADGLAQYVEEQYEYVAEKEHPFAKAITNGYAALDRVGQTAGSIMPETQQDVLAKAEASRNNDVTLAFKGAQLSELLKRNR